MPVAVWTSPFSWNWLQLEGKELGPLRSRPFYANQTSDLNFPIFQRGRRPELRRKRDLYEPLPTAMVQVLAILIQNSTKDWLHNFMCKFTATCNFQMSPCRASWSLRAKGGGDPTSWSLSGHLRAPLPAFYSWGPWQEFLREGREPPLTLRQEKQYLYFGHPFPCTPGPFSL